MANNIYFHKEIGHYQVAKKNKGCRVFFWNMILEKKAEEVRDYYKKNS